MDEIVREAERIRRSMRSIEEAAASLARMFHQSTAGLAAATREHYRQFESAALMARKALEMSRLPDITLATRQVTQVVRENVMLNEVLRAQHASYRALERLRVPSIAEMLSPDSSRLVDRPFPLPKLRRDEVKGLRKEVEDLREEVQRLREWKDSIEGTSNTPPPPETPDDPDLPTGQYL